jgi:acyl carrier protein
MEVEKTFGISIPDREAEQIITVGDFFDAVWQHLDQNSIEKCLSQSIFYRLRKSCCDSFGISKEQFQPDTSVEAIFPHTNRRQVYQDFSDVTSLLLPPLVLPQKWRMVLNTIGILAIAGGLVLAIILINFFDYSKWWWLLPMAGMILTGYISSWLNPMRTIVSPPLVKQFTQKVIILNFGTFRKDNKLNRKEVELIITHIIADKAGLEVDEITSEKKIADDLGIN